MSDQAHKLRELVSTAPPPARSAAAKPPWIVVTGGKEGVGVTTVAVNLRAALADAGLRVALADAANLFPSPGRSSSVAGCEPPASPRELPASDLVIVDAGNGASPGARRLWRKSRLMIVVTTGEDSAVMDCYALIKQAAADDLDAEIRLLVNQCTAPSIADGVYRRLSAATQRFLGFPVQAVPHLPRHVELDEAGEGRPPRVWETTDTPFGHAVLWLGRAVADLLAAPLAA